MPKGKNLSREKSSNNNKRNSSLKITLYRLSLWVTVLGGSIAIISFIVFDLPQRFYVQDNLFGSIAYYSISRTDNDRQIMTLDLEKDKSSSLVLNSKGIDEFPSWSGDGQIIYFDSTMFSDNRQLYSIKVDDNSVKRITLDEEDNWYPLISPDETRLLYISNSLKDPRRRDEIYIMNVDGSQKIQITYDPKEDKDPVWSPDGNSIAFVSDRTGISQIYIYSLLEGRTRQLTDTPYNKWHLAWSQGKDFSKIAFMAFLNNNVEIMTIDVTSGEILNLTGNPFADYDPAWSPDGSMIVFSSNREEYNGANNYEIYIMRSDGSNVQRLTHTEGDDFGPEWTLGITIPPPMFPANPVSSLTVLTQTYLPPITQTVPPPTPTFLPSNKFACNDTFDNDNDGFADYPIDPQCRNERDDDENR